MSTWNDSVIGMCLLLGVFLVLKEIRRMDRFWLAARVMATALALAALAGIGVTLKGNRNAGVAPETYRDSMATVGFVAADWQRQLTKGQRLTVQGRWKGTGASVLLMGVGEVLDSVEGKGEFELHTVPAQTGRAVYRLVALRGRDTLEREDLPVEVKTGRPLKILLLASSPDFENRFFIDWLARGGHEVAARTVVSKDRYEQTFANRTSRPLDVLTPGLLSGFDLVVADAAALPAEGGPAAALLHHQVEGGLGLLIRLDSVSQPVPGWVAGERPLIRDSIGRVIVWSGMDGAGRVVITAENRSYSRWMEGRRQEYADYWTTILDEAARKTGAEEEWRWRPGLPRVGEPVVAELETEAAFPQGIVGREAVYLAQDGSLPFLWRGKYWPEKAGWQQAHTLNGDTAWWYAWPAGAWKGIYPGRPIMGNATLRAESANKMAGWLYVVLFLSMTFLWVERKIGGMKG